MLNSTQVEIEVEVELGNIISVLNELYRLDKYSYSKLKLELM